MAKVIEFPACVDCPWQGDAPAVAWASCPNCGGAVGRGDPPKAHAPTKTPAELVTELDRKTSELDARAKQLTDWEAGLADYEKRLKDLTAELEAAKQPASPTETTEAETAPETKE